MKFSRLDDMTRGWFIGDFAPSVNHTKQFETAVQHFSKGDVEAAHFHKIATETTVIIKGEAIMGGRKCTEGDIIVVPPGEATSFEAVTDVTTVVVKFPSVPNDKYPA